MRHLSIQSKYLILSYRLILLTVAILIFSDLVCFANQGNGGDELGNLIQKLKSDDSSIRQKAVKEIPKYKNKAVNPLAQLLLENQSDSILVDVIRSMEQIKSAEAALALIDFFQRTHRMPNEVTSAMENIGKPAIEPLFKAYESSDNDTKTFILSALNNLSIKFITDKKLSDDAMRLFLKAFLNEKSINVRKIALSFLGQSPFEDDSEIRLAIKNALNDENEDIRKIAVRLLEPHAISYPDGKQEWIMDISKGLKKYYALHKQYPESLNDLLRENFIKKDWLVNPWGYLYIYEIDKERKSFKLISLGKDGKQNSEGAIVLSSEGEKSRKGDRLIK